LERLVRVIHHLGDVASLTTRITVVEVKLFATPADDAPASPGEQQATVMTALECVV
jgi:hypothetical protein